MSVFWSETATAQLQTIRDFLARSSPGYAQTLAERVVSRLEALDGQPHLGAEVPEYGDETIREIYEIPTASCIVWRIRTFRSLQSSTPPVASRELPVNASGLHERFDPSVPVGR